MRLQAPEPKRPKSEPDDLPEGVFSTHKLRDWDGSEVVALVHQRSNGHTTICVRENASGSAIRSEAAALIANLKYRTSRCELLLAGSRLLEIVPPSRQGAKRYLPAT